MTNISGNTYFCKSQKYNYIYILCIDSWKSKKKMQNISFIYYVKILKIYILYNIINSNSNNLYV